MSYPLHLLRSSAVDYVNGFGSRRPLVGQRDDPSLFGFRNANYSFVHSAPMSGKMTATRGGEGVAPDDCPNCGGSGYVAKPVDLNGKSEGVAFIRIKCPACGGTGRKHPISPTTVG